MSGHHPYENLPAKLRARIEAHLDTAEHAQRIADALAGKGKRYTSQELRIALRLPPANEVHTIN